MMNPKHQAKMAVLKHLSGMMDGMMSNKLKKPAIAEIEVTKIPHAPHAVDGASPEGILQDHSIDPNLDPTLHQAEQHTQHPDSTSDDDLAKLHEMYSKLK
jgi:hypothetical protein